jgi:hypothetical protein
MSEKYYVVSVAELADMYFAGETQSDDLTDAAWAACRAREVRFIGAADQGNSLMLWGEVKK